MFSTKWRCATVGALAGVLALAACGTGTSTGSGGPSGDTVAVDVGNGSIDLPKGKLRLGIFFNAQSNQWQKQVAETAKARAEKLGWTATVLDANFDPAVQLNQLQTAATNKSFDAAIVVPIDDGECQAITETLPKAGTLVTVLSAPVCDRAQKAGDDLWVPGTLNYVGGDTSADYYRGWFKAAAELNPGPQKVAIVIGPELSPFTLVQKAVAKEFEKANPDFEITDYVYTDYTTPSGFSATQSYLRSHPETTVLLSVYTPDLTRGVVSAVAAADKSDDVKIVDIGGSTYTIDEIKKSNVQATLGFFPTEAGEYSVDAIAEAQEGTEPKRFVSVVPEQYGSVENPFVVTADNVDEFKPEF